MYALYASLKRLSWNTLAWRWNGDTIIIDNKLFIIIYSVQ